MKEQIKKQAIEEMARKMCRNFMPNGNCASDGDPCGLECVYGFCAERIYCAGYRKQIVGEWETILHNPRGEMLNVYSHICKVEGCGYFYKDIRPYGHKFCPNCGAKMKGGAE